MGAWVYGCIGVWAYGCDAALAHRADTEVLVLAAFAVVGERVRAEVRAGVTVPAVHLGRRECTCRICICIRICV